MQQTKLLAASHLLFAVFASLVPTGAATSDQLILQQIANYRTWNRVTPEIIKQLPEGVGFAAAG